MKTLRTGSESCRTALGIRVRLAWPARMLTSQSDFLDSNLPTLPDSGRQALPGTATLRL